MRNVNSSDCDDDDVDATINTRSIILGSLVYLMINEWRDLISLLLIRYLTPDSPIFRQTILALLMSLVFILTSHVVSNAALVHKIVSVLVVPIILVGLLRVTWVLLDE